MMEQQKILNLLNEENDFKFVTRKWNVVNDNSKQILMQQTKLPMIQKFSNLIFVITKILTF